MNLSPNEIKLFSAVDSISLAFRQAVLNGAIDVMDAYKYFTLAVFANNETGGHVEALRRAMKHFSECKYRGNPEFEKLIEF